VSDSSSHGADVSTPAQAYEAFVAEVVRGLVGVEVFQGKGYTGRISGRSIKVDVSFTFNVAGGARLLVLVECKCYAHRVSVADVEEFHSKIDDIGAHKGIMVTTVGFQDGAVKVATGRRMALALLTRQAQPGELRYITADASRSAPPPLRSHDGFLQGNIRGVLGMTDGGVRFEDGGTLLGILLVDAMSEER